MAFEHSARFELEIADVLFIDTVGYSKLRIGKIFAELTVCGVKEAFAVSLSIILIG